jgi:hypothetical protein
VADEWLVGTVGRVVRAIRGEGLPGEVRVVDGGEIRMVLAFCAQPLEVGERVRIVRGRGWRQVDVVPWLQRG